MAPLIWLAVSGISATLYRVGGMSKDDEARPKWVPKWLRRSWVRDWLIPLVSLGYLLTLWGLQNSTGWLLLLPCILLNSGALSTYWDWLFKEKDNFYMHGFMCSLALFPLYWAGIHWYAILIRAVVCALGMGVWSNIMDKDIIEEGGRGFIHTATIPLLLI